jgi:hypothetical protein
MPLFPPGVKQVPQRELIASIVEAILLHGTNNTMPRLHLTVQI